MQILARLKYLKRLARYKFAGTLSAVNPRAVDPAYTGVTAFAVCRDELALLPHWFAHHRQLGVTRFLVVDNGSTDGSLDFLRAQSDVYLFTSTGSFQAANFGALWAEELIVRFGLRGWFAFLDLDEFLIYPECEAVALPAFTGYLDSMGERAVFAPLIDMYANAPLSQAKISQAHGPLRVCPFFDADTLFTNGLEGYSPSGLRYSGGMRARALKIGVCLNKIPLLRVVPGVRLYGGWHFTDVTPVSRTRGAVLHFKFTERFSQRTQVEAQRGEHWRQGVEYRHYRKMLEVQSDPNLHFPGSVRFESSQTLLDHAIMQAPPSYWDWLRRMKPTAHREQRAVGTR